MQKHQAEICIPGVCVCEFVSLKGRRKKKRVCLNIKSLRLLNPAAPTCSWPCAAFDTYEWFTPALEYLLTIECVEGGWVDAGGVSIPPPHLPILTPPTPSYFPLLQSHTPSLHSSPPQTRTTTLHSTRNNCFCLEGV